MILEKFRLEGRNALVTGSRSGLGAAMAIALAQAGANVVVHGSKCRGSSDTETDEVCAAVKATGRKAVRAIADLSDPKSAGELVSLAVAQLGSVDILVNNAGTIRRAPAVDYSEKDWADVLGVNLDAVFRLSQLAGRHMIEQGGGKIINIASMLSFQGGVLVPAYAASKGAVAQLTKALANEWASKGVNVNAIAPGYMETQNTAQLRADPVRSRAILDRIPAGRWGAPEDVVGAAVFLASPASDYIHGHVLAVDGGWLAR
jgi:2-deoxy-D-gluconate 3-dehydrogenase